MRKGLFVSYNARYAAVPDKPVFGNAVFDEDKNPWTQYPIGGADDVRNLEKAILSLFPLEERPELIVILSWQRLEL